MSLLLGQGEFATVIEGKMKRHGEEQSVALKIWNESLDINNASHVLAEASLLRYEFFLTFNFIAELHIILSFLGTARNLRN